MKNLRNKIALIFVSLLILASCTKEYTPGTENYEKDLVVEATITNELKKQKIKLSYTADFARDTVILEKNATVQVIENNSTVYDFTYKESDSAYFSNEAFKALPDKEYQLRIKTQNGRQYLSDPQIITPESQVDIVAKAGTSKKERGLRIEANSYDSTSDSNYYRYEYEETYQVTLPYYGIFKAVQVAEDSLALEPRDDPFPICYNNIKSNNLILKKTTDLSENRVADFLVAFRSIDDYAIAEKYSILIKQYVESPEAYAYYKTLDKISSSNGNDLSVVQPGFIQGNIHAENNPDEKVIGYFDVASVSSQRIFAKSFLDYFPDDPLPPYFEDCEVVSLDSTDWIFGNMHYPEGLLIAGYIESGRKIVYQTDSNNTNLYIMVKAICGNCSQFSTHEEPNFW